MSGWKKRWDLAKDVEVPVFDEVFARLEASLPESSRTAIVHNDLKLDNCQFDPTEPDRVKLLLCMRAHIFKQATETFGHRPSPPT